MNLGLAALEGGDLQATEEGIQALQATMQKSRAAVKKRSKGEDVRVGISYAMELCHDVYIIYISICSSVALPTRAWSDICFWGKLHDATSS